MNRRAGITLLWLLAGCTHEQLATSTARTASTVMDIQYQMVVDNLAGMQRNPAALPAQIRIKQGTVQVSDEVGFYQLEVSGSASGTFGGPRAERTVSEQWGADAITDPLALQQLQDVYRAAMRLPPLEEPAFLHLQQVQAASKASTKPKSGQSPLDAMMKINLQRDVPLGWFKVGSEKQVPADARYVGHSGDSWAWVSPNGLPGLSRFTLLILFITKLGPGENTGAGMGLMYTGGGK